MNVRSLCTIASSLCLSVWLLACSERGSAPAKAAPPAPLFMLSADGVGPLNASTPFNLRQIGDAFQNFNVAEEIRFLNGSQYPMITVRQGAEHLLSVNPDHRGENIFSIIIYHNRIGNKLGHRIGQKFSEVYRYGRIGECGPGIEEWAGKVMCYAPQNNNILYLFAGEQAASAQVAPKRSVEASVPPPDEMTDWRLEAIVWKPPGS